MELISFDLCPFVQRSVITLLKKNAKFDITYIDLETPPDWFLKISPFGKVPVLKAENQVIFESAVINEYVDEVTPPALMPQKPIDKALNRAWIEFASELLMYQYQLSIAENQEIFDSAESKLLISFEKLEDFLTGTEYFNGSGFSLVDAAFAPLFTRFDILLPILENEILEDKPKINQWAKKLVAEDAVKRSVKPDFNEKYLQYIHEHSNFMAEYLSR